MASVSAFVAALALLCVAGALLLWQRGVQRQSRVSTERFIDSRTARPHAVAGAAPGAAAGATSSTAMPLSAHARASSSTQPGGRAVPALAGAAGAAGALAVPRVEPPANRAQARWRAIKARASIAFDHALIRAGITDARLPAVLALGATAAACLWVGSVRGGLAALATLAACCALLSFWFSSRTRRRRQKIVRQLPAFLDGIVRLIVLGNSVPAAFQASLLNTEAPLRECLDQVSRMLRTGAEIDRALDHVASVYRARELGLVGSVLRLSVKYGGRADVMLDRMASFMRDLEQAERELTALTAETRLSAWVLTALPIGIGGTVIVMSPSYFNVMWQSDGGRDFIYAAFGLQALGAYLLYRLARVKG